MRPIIFICVTVYAAAMAAVALGAREIVGRFGVVGGLLTIAAIYLAARYFERPRAAGSAPCESKPETLANRGSAGRAA